MDIGRVRCMGMGGYGYNTNNICPRSDETHCDVDRAGLGSDVQGLETAHGVLARHVTSKIQKPI